MYRSPILGETLVGATTATRRAQAPSGQIEAVGGTCGPPRSKRFVVVAQGRRGSPAAGSRPRTLGKKFTTTKLAEERRAGGRSDDEIHAVLSVRSRMNIERIVSSSERGFVERSVDYIESCMNTHHAQTKPTAGCFVLGVSGPNGRVRRERALDTFTELAAREGIEWERVRVFLVDERYGELPTEEDSNAHLMRRAFSKRLPEAHPKPKPKPKPNTNTNPYPYPYPNPSPNRGPSCDSNRDPDRDPLTVTLALP